MSNYYIKVIEHFQAEHPKIYVSKFNINYVITFKDHSVTNGMYYLDNGKIASFSENDTMYGPMIHIKCSVCNNTIFELAGH